MARTVITTQPILRITLRSSSALRRHAARFRSLHQPPFHEVQTLLRFAQLLPQPAQLDLECFEPLRVGCFEPRPGLPLATAPLQTLRPESEAERERCMDTGMPWFGPSRREAYRNQVGGAQQDGDRQPSRGLEGHHASGGATPLKTSQNPSGISYAAIGNHMSCVTAPRSNPPSCSGRATTIRMDATTPSHASGTGIIRPRSSNQEKSVLPRAKKLAATRGLSSSTNPPSVCADARSGAFVASHSSPSVAGMETAPVTPSATRQVSPSIARSASWSRVIAHRLTASASAQQLLSRERTATRCTSVACWATEASFAAIPSPLVARLIRTMLGNATAM